MHTNISKPHPSNYEAIIQLMQTYDCSYQQAQQHYRLLQLGNFQHQSPKLHPINESALQEQDSQEGVLAGHDQLLQNDQVIPFTAKEVRALKQFFNGSLPVKNRGKPSFCERATLKFKAIKRTMKCLKYLNPRRLWRVIKKARGWNYNKISNQDTSTHQSENAKIQQNRSEKWTEIDTDWMDELQEISQELANYLAAHKELVREIKALGGSGLKTSIPSTMEIPSTLRPFLFVREKIAEGIAENVKEAAQKCFKVVCLGNHQFNLLHSTLADYSQTMICSLASYNIFEELQILNHYKNLAIQDVEKGERTFEQFVIKNRLFQSILERQISEIAFNFEEASVESSEEDEEQQTRRKEMETHQSIIRQQDMLYQSMLSSYTSKETEREKEDESFIQFQRQRQALKSSIKEEPTPSTSTIYITFRTPVGNNISRHFQKDDTIQYVKSWIMAEEQIEFEEANSSFDLYHGYPPTLIESHPSSTLASTFGEQESKLKLIIKEN